MADCSCTNFPASLGNVTFGADVGIGTSSPTARLSVAGDLDFPANAALTSAGYVRMANVADYGLQIATANFGLTAAYGSDTTLRFVVTAGGNVGVGTSAPSKPLEVASGAAKLGGGIVFGTGSQGGVPGMHGDGTNLYLEADAGALYFRPQGEGDNTSAAVLTSRGYLGVLTLDPGYPLDVAGTVRCTGVLLGGDQLMSGALKDSTGNVTIADTGGCYYAD